jgi:phospholipase A2
MIGVLGYCEEIKKAGLWDVFMYVAGVSGSCWSLAAYYTFGATSMTKVIGHCKKRLSPYHPLSYKAIQDVINAKPYATLGPLIQKRTSGLKTVVMDLYSVLTTGYLFFHDDPALKPGGPGRDARKEVAGYHGDWYKWSNALLQDCQQPLPILTAVRHEIPWTGKGEIQDSWFQWFEMTPFEVGCDELEAWVPTWGFGRPFSGGKSVMQLPEQSLALLLGLCTSAPAAHLKSYIDTVKRNLPQNFVGDTICSIARQIARFWGKQRWQLIQMHHPIHACNEHNFL